MADNKNFDIGLVIDPNSQQQIELYKRAFDYLRISINNLSNPIIKLEGSITKLSGSVDKLSKENKGLGDSIDQVKKASDAAKFVIDTLKKSVDVLKLGVGSLEAVLTGGLTLIIAYGPQIYELITSLGKGKDAIDKAKFSISALNSALQSADYSNAIKQLNEFKINTELAQKGLLNKKETLSQYNTTVGKTMGQVANLNEAESKITKNGDAYIKMTLLKASAQLALQDAAKKAYEAEQAKLKSDDDSLTFWDKTKIWLKRGLRAASGPAGLMTADIEADKIILAKQRREEEESDLIKQKNALLAIGKGFETEAAELARESGFNFFGNTPTTSSKGKTSSPTFNPEAQKQQALQRLKQTADEFNKYLEQQNNNYEVEHGRLKHQLDNKLITQEEYFEQWAQLQEKHHTGIGESIKLFNEQDLAATQKHQKDLLDADGLKEIEKKGEQELSHALLPAQKLQAEKDLITAKYEFEIQKAAEAGKDTTDIRLKYQQDTAEADKRFAEQRKEFELQTAQQVSDAAFSILQNNIKAGSAAKLKQLDTQKTAELSNTSLTGAQKKTIEEKYKKKEAEEKVKTFKAEQRTSILQAVVNGALAITKATAQTGVLAPFVIPAIIASTAIQVATIAAQKAPQYAKGGLHYQSDGKGAVLPGYSRIDNTNAYLRSGEAVVVSEAMRNPWARNLVSAINVAYGGRDFSVANASRGYAIGGIFTDGGNSNRYYSQPMNDVKDLANTIAYQMVNNLPPIYVDVKDVNSQQNILAQTVNRVNL